jgi:DNA-binding SARP family transcriptional activator
MNSRLSVQLLGRFVVRRDGHELTLPASARRVVSFIAVHDEPVLRGRVASQLWMDVPDDRSMANLRSALWRVRMIEPHLLKTTPTAIAIGDDVDVDLHHARLAASILNGSEPPEEVFVFLYDELLPDDYDDWVVVERERYRNLRLHALERRCATLRDRGRFAEAVDIGLTVIAMDPLRETAHEAVIRVHLAENNLVEAIRQYRTYAHLVSQELGIDPSSTLEQLIGTATSNWKPLDL